MAALCRCALFLVLLHFLTSRASQDDLIVSIKDGKVKGKLVNGNVRAFLGIPYGKPPLGKLRFKPPEPVVGWDGVRNTTNFPNSCYQIPDKSLQGFKGVEMWNPNTPVSEDCLYLNVWSPHVNKTLNQPPPLAPVLVWIYGGGFAEGTSSLDVYDGRFLSKSEGVVVVSMNYRVGALGFLSFPNNQNIKGNTGLLDQRLALKWVAHNIAAFGGDPSKVTLFGESAGSASVGFHLLSPGSQHLFQRAVMQSGSPNAPWATNSPSVAEERSLNLATILGCPTSPPARLETCMQQVDARQIATEQNNVFETPSIPAFAFLPQTDKNFLPDHVDVLLNNGNLPKKDLMLGLNKDEGTFFIVYAVPRFNTSGENMVTRKQFLEAVELAMSTDSDVSRKAAIFQYTDWADETDGLKNRDALGSLFGDQSFNCPLLEFAQRYSQNGGKTYLYSFDHRSSVNPWPEWMGVMHGYEIEFVFGMPLNPLLGYTRNEVNMTRKIMKHWANFARTGNPEIDGAKWPLFSHEQQEYVTLNYNDLSLKRMMRPKECHLWNRLVPQLQNISDELLSCVNGSGTTSCCRYVSVLLLFTFILTF